MNNCSFSYRGQSRLPWEGSTFEQRLEGVEGRGRGSYGGRAFTQRKLLM